MCVYCAVMSCPQQAFQWDFSNSRSDSVHCPGDPVHICSSCQRVADTLAKLLEFMFPFTSVCANPCRGLQTTLKLFSLLQFRAGFTTLPSSPWLIVEPSVAPTLSTSIDNNQGVSPLKMQDLVENSSRIADLGILKTGQFSDARLKMGDTVWKVHKSIVCPRSGFMMDAFCPSSEPEVDDVSVDGLTKEQMDLLLEFIYSSSKYQRVATAGCCWLRLIRHSGIKTINGLSLKECVDLCSMGKHCRVQGMVWYAVNTLWDKLMRWDWVMPMLHARPSGPPICDSAIAYNSDRCLFIKNFKMAVIAAYSDPDNACQLALADFVFVANEWFRYTQVIQKLSTSYPEFGSHLFTISLRGPQCQFLRSDRKLIAAANPAPN